ncbi:MAG TPA: head GIN domain-containing protein [Usitatibacter sp.]|nr:head GIN domain-containing protein [Usitatibacter sp.]
MNAIRRTLLATLALACAPLAWAENVVGSGKAVTEKRAVSGFRAVAVSVPGSVELVQGGSESLTLTADDNVAPLIESVVEDGKLRIRFRERGNLNVSPRVPIRIAITARVVDSITVAGATNVRATGLSTASLQVTIAGSGDVHLAGKAEQLDLNVAGSGSVKATALDTQRTKISIAGSGDAEVWARAELRASIAGSGDVRYYGDPQIHRSVIGSGSVRRVGATPG